MSCATGAEMSLNAVTRMKPQIPVAPCSSVMWYHHRPRQQTQTEPCTLTDTHRETRSSDSHGWNFQSRTISVSWVKRNSIHHSSQRLRCVDVATRQQKKMKKKQKIDFFFFVGRSDASKRRSRTRACTTRDACASTHTAARRTTRAAKRLNLDASRGFERLTWRARRANKSDLIDDARWLLVWFETNRGGQPLSTILFARNHPDSKVESPRLVWSRISQVCFAQMSRHPRRDSIVDANDEVVVSTLHPFAHAAAIGTVSYRDLACRLPRAVNPNASWKNGEKKKKK